MSDGLWQMARPDLEDRIAELEAENKRLRKCADAMADAISDDKFNSLAKQEAYWKYRAVFPREEAKHG